MECVGEAGWMSYVRINVAHFLKSLLESVKIGHGGQRICRVEHTSSGGLMRNKQFAVHWSNGTQEMKQIVLWANQCTVSQ